MKYKILKTKRTKTIENKKQFENKKQEKKLINNIFNLTSIILMIIFSLTLSINLAFSEKYYENDFNINNISSQFDNNINIDINLYSKWPDENLNLKIYLENHNTILEKQEIINTKHGDNIINFQIQNNKFNFKDYNLTILLEKNGYDLILKKTIKIINIENQNYSNSVKFKEILFDNISSNNLNYNTNYDEMVLILENQINLKNIELITENYNYPSIEIENNNLDRIYISLNTININEIKGFYYNLENNNEKFYYNLENDIQDKLREIENQNNENTNINYIKINEDKLYDNNQIEGPNLRIYNLEYDENIITFNIENNGNEDITLFEINLYDDNLNKIKSKRVLYLKTTEILKENMTGVNLTSFSIAIEPIGSNFNEVIFEDNYIFWPLIIQDYNQDSGNYESGGGESSRNSKNKISNQNNLDESNYNSDNESKKRIEITEGNILSNQDYNNLNQSNSSLDDENINYIKLDTDRTSLNVKKEEVNNDFEKTEFKLANKFNLDLNYTEILEKSLYIIIFIITLFGIIIFFK